MPVYVPELLANRDSSDQLLHDWRRPAPLFGKDELADPLAGSGSEVTLAVLFWQLVGICSVADSEARHRLDVVWNVV